MNSCTSALDLRLIGSILFGLSMFGLAYNALVTWLSHRKAGYTALLVAGGVAITLLGLALIDWRCAAITLAMFVASGTPMIIGDILRHVHDRERAVREYKSRYDEKA